MQNCPTTFAINPISGRFDFYIVILHFNFSSSNPRPLDPLNPFLFHIYYLRRRVCSYDSDEIDAGAEGCGRLPDDRFVGEGP